MRHQGPLTCLLPAAADVAVWFVAFLSELHELDPARVPHAPPRLSKPSDWYTPQERDLADRIAAVDAELERLNAERDQHETELAAEGERAAKGIRRAIWADG